MGKRTTSRRLAMQALYEAEHGGSPIETSLENLFEESDFHIDTKEFSKELATKAWDMREKSDATIKELAKGYSLDRIGGVDRSILRLAICELEQKETPNEVIINEAIELAKKFSTDEAAKFINGILGAYLKNK